MAHLTVAIPFYNNAQTLGAAVQSVFSQTFTDWELILLDDGSVDESLAIAQSISDPRVRVVTDGRNRGLVHRLNQSISLARGGLYSRMDADDLMHPERLAKQVEYLRTHPEVDLIGTSMCTIDAANVPLGLQGTITWKGFKRPNHATVTGLTDWFRSNPYDPIYHRAQDLELWVRTHRTAKVANLPQPLYFYRLHNCYNYRKYWLTYCSERRIIRQYGPCYRGRHWTYYQLAVTWGKVMVHAAFQLIGSEEILVRRRVRRLSTEEHEAAGQTIARILTTSVRGLYPARIAAKQGAAP
jgi:glycosyltransferase involved in cell wall biosynthesis